MSREKVTAALVGIVTQAFGFVRGNIGPTCCQARIVKEWEALGSIVTARWYSGTSVSWWEGGFDVFYQLVYTARGCNMRVDGRVVRWDVLGSSEVPGDAPAWDILWVDVQSNSTVVGDAPAWNIPWDMHDATGLTSPAGLVPPRVPPFRPRTYCRELDPICQESPASWR